MNKVCKIVEDLIPLYIENLTNEENTLMIENHLKECESCKRIYNEMKEDIGSNILGSDKTIEKNTQGIIKVISRYQNLLKFALCFLIMLFGVVITSVGVPFLSTFALLIIAPIVCTFIYKNNVALVLINIIVSIVGGYIVTGSFQQLPFVSLGQFLLMLLALIVGNLIRVIANRGLNIKKRIALGIIAFIIIGFSLFINNAFCGNPVSYIITHNRVSKYLKETYPNKNMKVKNIYNQWTDGSYNIEAFEGESTFYISAYRTGYINDHYKINRVDNYYKSYSNMIKLTLESELENQYFWVVSTVNMDKYDGKTIEPLKDTNVIIRFAQTNEKYPNLTVFTKEEFFNQCKAVIEILDKSDIQYNNIVFQSQTENSGEFYLSVNGEPKFEDIMGE